MPEILPHGAAMRATGGAETAGLASRVARGAMLLVLPLTLLLFAQWPLRDLVGRGSVQANDVAQVLFAWYVAVALAHGHVRGTHLVARPDLALDRRGWRRWRAVAGPATVGLWAAGVMALSAPSVVRSIVALERFPETDTPGYFLIKLALLVLALLLLAQAFADLRGAWPQGER